VSGHGVAAALLSVTLSRVLSPAGDPESILLRPGGQSEERLVPPAEVAERLNQKFPWDEATEQFFTIVYGIVDAKTKRFRYASAGHPGVIHLGRDAQPVLHATPGFPIGLGGGYEEHTVQLQSGDRLYLYSDGATEAMSPDGKLFGNAQLLLALERGRTEALQQSISMLIDELRRWCGTEMFGDDVSVLAIEAT
jgi:phosphoserine phosphatase RsbU/P